MAIPEKARQVGRPAPSAATQTPLASEALARFRGTLGPALLALALAALLLLAADIALLWRHPGVYYVPVGNFRDRYFLTGAHRQEQEADGSTYRWTQGTSTLWLNRVGVTPHTLLTLDLGGRPEPAALRLTLNERPWLGFTAETTPRHYTLLLPPSASETLAIGIESPTFQAPGDPRALGVKVEGFTVRNVHIGAPLPPAGQYLAQFALLALVQVVALRLGWAWRAQAALLAALALGLAALLSGELLLAMEFLPRLVVFAALLAALTWLALPPLERWTAAWGMPRGELRLLWALALGAVAIRLLGVLYPSFGGQDLGRNLDRLFATINGQLYIIAPSGEFARGLTIYPTGPYLALMPGVLVTDDFSSLMQGGLALMDGATALLTGLLAYRMSGSRHAARLALALYAGNTAAFGAMSYSFSAQIFGQWFTAPLALLLLSMEEGPRGENQAMRAGSSLSALASRLPWLLAVLLLSFGVFSHIGVAFLGIGWMGLTLLLETLARRRAPWWGWGLFLASCALALGLLYVEIVGVTLQHAAEKVVPRSVGSGTLFPGYRILLVNGVRLAYSDVGLMLLPLGLLLARVWRSPALLAWLGAALFFLLVDLVLNVQVRYFYFALPLVLAAIGVALGGLAARGRGGRLAAWALALAVVLPQVALWFSATWGDGKVPMTPLTH